MSEQELERWYNKNNLNINNKFNYLSISFPGSTHSAGVALRYKPCYQVVKKWRDEASCLIVAELYRDDLNFQVVCLYGPNNKDDGAVFFESLYQAIDPCFSAEISTPWSIPAWITSVAIQSRIGRITGPQL